MANILRGMFQTTGGQTEQTQTTGKPRSIQEAARMVQQNPSEMISFMGWNVPQNILQSGDGNAVLNHLMSTGQINQSQIAQVLQRVRR